MEVIKLGGGIKRFTEKNTDKRSLCISNHGNNGIKNIAYIFENLENAVIDGEGITVSLCESVIPVYLCNCKNVTLKNITVQNEKTGNLWGKVIAVTDSYADIEIMSCDEYIFKENNIYVYHNDELMPVFNSLEYEPTGEVAQNKGDQSFGDDFAKLKKEMISENILRVYSPPAMPKKDNRIMLHGARKRMASGIFVKECEDIFFEDIAINSCEGMGIIAQMCNNIDLKNINVEPYGERPFSANADALHFVNCMGQINVINCYFSGQLDDAINIHGIYTPVESFKNNEIVIKYAHDETSGIGIYQKGDRVSLCDKKTLLEKESFTIADVIIHDDRYTTIVLDRIPAEIKIGDVFENITRCTSLCVSNCIIKNNRGRGMLIAAKGDVLIEKCRFHTPGPAIKLECDGEYWFESGGVSNLQIKNNFFDNCLYSKSWGSDVIEVSPRNAVEKSRYYHKKIVIENNTFDGCSSIFSGDNIEELVFLNNKFEGNVNPSFKVRHIKKIRNDDMKAIDYAKMLCKTMMKTPAELMGIKEFFHYHQGVACLGMQNIYEITGDEELYEYTKRWADSVINDDGSLKNYNPNDLDDLMAGGILHLIYEKSGEEKYKKVLDDIADRLCNWKKNEVGGFWHLERTPHQMWLDGLFMAESPAIRYAYKYGRSELFDIMYTQANLMWDNMRDERTGLLKHAWDYLRAESWADTVTGLAPEFWGRSLGWYAVALCDMVEYMPDKYKDNMIQKLNFLIDSLCKYQDKESGMWYQIINKGNEPDNWTEVSCTCLFVYAMCKGMRLGFLDKDYSEQAINAFNGICDTLTIDENGDLLVNKVCIGTGVGQYEFYIQRPTSTNDLHGIGAFLLMCGEYNKYIEKEN